MSHIGSSLQTFSEDEIRQHAEILSGVDVAADRYTYQRMQELLIVLDRALRVMDYTAALVWLNTERGSETPLAQIADGRYQLPLSALVLMADEARLPPPPPPVPEPWPGSRKRRR